MTGTQSLSFAELQTIWDEVGRVEIEARRSGQRHDTEVGRVYTGQPLTVVIHQAEPGWQLGEHYKTAADKRVAVHRAFADSKTFWLSRNGESARYAYRK